MKKLLLLFLLSFPAFSQYYILQKTTITGSTFEALTIDAPGTTGSGRIVRFRSAYADCSIACTITLSRTGTAPTGNAAPQVPANLNRGETAASAFGYNTSDAGAGTTLAVYQLGAGGAIAIDLTGKTMELKSNADDNLTLKTSTTAGTVHMFIQWQEVDH